MDSFILPDDPAQTALANQIATKTADLVTGRVQHQFDAIERGVAELAQRQASAAAYSEQMRLLIVDLGRSMDALSRRQHETDANYQLIRQEINDMRRQLDALERRVEQASQCESCGRRVMEVG